MGDLQQGAVTVAMIPLIFHLPLHNNHSNTSLSVKVMDLYVTGACYLDTP